MVGSVIPNEQSGTFEKNLLPAIQPRRNLINLSLELPFLINNLNKSRRIFSGPKCRKVNAI